MCLCLRHKELTEKVKHDLVQVGAEKLTIARFVSGEKNI